MVSEELTEIFRNKRKRGDTMNEFPVPCYKCGERAVKDEWTLCSVCKEEQLSALTIESRYIHINCECDICEADGRREAQ